MPEQPTFPPELQRVLGRVLEVSAPKQGATSQVWIVKSAVGERVVKQAIRPPYTEWLANEGYILNYLNAAHFRERAQNQLPFPFPKLYFDGTQGKAGHSLPYLVMNRLPGEPLATVMGRENDPGRRLHWMHVFGETLRKIHTHPAVLTQHIWLDERLNTAAGYIEAEYELDADDPQPLLEQLRKNRPAPVTPTLIHGDFMWDNVLVEDDKITGIIDWGGGAYGDPRYDLALAILPHEDGEISDNEVTAFYAGYGREPLTEAEYRYFTDLYGFF